MWATASSLSLSSHPDLDTQVDNTGSAPPAEPAARETFVVRILSSDGSDGVRGHIEHVSSRKRAYFATRKRLLTFIEEHFSENSQCPR